MKKVIMVLVASAIVVGSSNGFVRTSYASDWDKAGIILTGIEGMRILTGGKVDIIGNIAGINNNNKKYHIRDRHHRKHRRHPKYCSNRVWRPNYVWKRKFIPEHTEYDQKHGEIVVEGHHIKFKIQRGGEWVTTCKTGKKYR